MAINLKFDLTGNPEPPTIILANRNGNKLGQLKVNEDSIGLSDKFNDASEISFTVNKYIDNNLVPLWDKIVDFKLVYCKEWDLWFEIRVELDEETETVKTVFCTQLGQAELSQIMLYDIEINTEKDIERDDYKISILYDVNDPKSSILIRLLEKAPHYSIVHVDPTIAKIQRSFSFDGTSIYDAFQEIAEEIGCLFVYNSNSDEYGKIQRTISVYDLWQCCEDCDYRGEYTDKCPKCGSTNVKTGYGDDTLIFVTSDELASGGIQLTTDTDSVKNCFKLEAGDDLMTATVRNCNPNGTDYIWYFSDSIKEDMSDELVERLISYNKIYRQYYDEYVSNIDTNLLNDYNRLIEKYFVYNEDLKQIDTPIVSYSALMNAYYNVIDLSLYLKSGLMPNIKMSGTTAEEQARLLTSSLSSVAVTDVSIASLATVNSAALAMAKTIVRPTYKTQVNTSELFNSGNSRFWKGNFIITNYSDEEDSAISDIVTVEVNDDLEAFINQKIDKALNKENTDDLSISGLFKKDYDDFCEELKKYALNPLISFHDACQACIDILIEQGVADKNTWSDNEVGSEGNLYENLYMPYYDKLMAIESEIKVREDEINIISGVYDLDGNLIIKGLQTHIEECKFQIQDTLNFEKYLGVDLWHEFCAYRREDKYSNDNYISDGLDNAELFKRALEFFEVAENEIYKSAELQHSISTTLNNLLAIPKFKPLVESFKVGNWIRVRVDDKIYKLRLLEYEIDYGDFNNISVEFSDVTKIKNGITDVESILSQASSMSTSYNAVQRQASQGNEAKTTIEQWFAEGLNSALVQIQSNDNEDITITKNGLLCRSYDDITGTYLPEQLKLTHNIMAYTDDDWKTVRQAIGKHEYLTYDESQDKWTDSVGYGMSADFVSSGQIMGSKIVGGLIYSSNYHKGVSGSTSNSPQGTYINLKTGDFEFANGKLVYDSVRNMLTLDGVTIEWSTTNTPDVSTIDGLDAQLSQIDGRIDVLDTAVAKQLGINGTTVIGADKVISPYIGGGYLNIMNSNNNSRVIIDPNNLTGNDCIFQVHDGNQVTVGIDSEGNAVFKGNISGSTFESTTEGNFSIDEQGTISAKNLSSSEAVYTDTIYCNNIACAEYPKTLTANPTLYVNSESGTDDQECVNEAVFQTLQGAIDSIPKFMNGRSVYIELQTDVTENVTIRCFSSGHLYLYFAGHTLYGYIHTQTCNAYIGVYGGTKTGGGTDLTGVIHPATGIDMGGYTSSFAVDREVLCYVSNLKIYGADNLLDGTSNRSCVSAQYGLAYAINIGITNTQVGFRANAAGRIYVSSSNGVAEKYGFYATSGGHVSLNSGSQSGGNTANTFENNGGTIKYHSPVFETGNTTVSGTSASTTKVSKNVTYTSSKGNSIQSYGTTTASWRSDNVPKVGTWGYGNHVAFWFFGDKFENIASKDVTKIEITFNRIAGGYSSAVTHNFYAHEYESQPKTVKPSYTTKIGSVSVATGSSAKITITDSSLISTIISKKGICSIPPSQSKAYYSVMSGTMKVKFYYTE